MNLVHPISRGRLVSAFSLLLASMSLGFPEEPARAQPSPSKLPSDAVPTVLSHGVTFVAAVNDTSTEARLRAVRQIYAASALGAHSEESLVGLFAKLREDLGELEHDHSEVVLSSLHVFVRSGRSGGWKDLQFQVETRPPYGIEDLPFIADVEKPVYLPSGNVRSAETVDWLNGHVETLMASEGLAGRILLAQGELPFFHRAFGYVDSARVAPVLPSTRFNLGAGNQMFTALSILMLEEEGLLGLDDPVTRHLPSFPDAKIGGRITIRHLLSHSSGLGDYGAGDSGLGDSGLGDSGAGDSGRNGRQWTRLSEVEPRVYRELAENGLRFDPGTQHRDSNSAFLLLGRVVEEVSGEDYFDFVRERIYEPLGMKYTDSYPMDGTVPGLAPALVALGDAPLRPADRAPDLGALGDAPLRPAENRRWTRAKRDLRGTSAGGGFSNTTDMFRFVRALVGGEIVSEKTLTTMATLQPGGSGTGAEGLGHGPAYGLGFLLEQSNSGAISFGHGGNAPGVRFDLRYFPESDITFILFCNQDNEAYDDLRRNVVTLITGDR